MLITLYTPIGIVYQKFNINEYDLKYNDLIKYINLPKNELYDELDESKQIWNKVFVKTIINLFTYENSEKINLDDEILCECNEFTIIFSYEYYIYYEDEDEDDYVYYKKLENNIKNCNNVFDEIKNEPYKIIFIDNNENYYQICKLAVRLCGYTLQCIKNQTYKICKLAVKQDGLSLQYVKPELMPEEICKLAIQNDCYALQYIKPELMTDEICKLAIKNDGYALQFVKPELMTDEICKLAVQQNGYVLRFVKQELMTYEICKLAVKQYSYELQYVKEEFITPELLKLSR
jgi:hypothetical protein